MRGLIIYLLRQHVLLFVEGAAPKMDSGKVKSIGKIYSFDLNIWDTWVVMWLLGISYFIKLFSLSAIEVLTIFYILFWNFSLIFQLTEKKSLQQTQGVKPRTIVLVLLIENICIQTKLIGRVLSVSFWSLFVYQNCDPCSHIWFLEESLMAWVMTSLTSSPLPLPLTGSDFLQCFTLHIIWMYKLGENDCAAF